MKLCLDSSVLCKLFGTEDDSEKMIRIIDMAAGDGIELIASELALFEVGNFLWKAHRRGKPLLKDPIEHIFDLDIEFVPVTVRSAETALATAGELDLTFYDSVHISLAIGNGCPLVTADKEILSECDDAITLEEALDMIAMGTA